MRFLTFESIFDLMVSEMKEGVTCQLFVFIYISFAFNINGFVGAIFFLDRLFSLLLNRFVSMKMFASCVVLTLSPFSFANSLLKMKKREKNNRFKYGTLHRFIPSHGWRMRERGRE